MTENLRAALKLVLELAEDAVLDERDCDGDIDLLEGRERQLNAIELVEAELRAPVNDNEL